MARHAVEFPSDGLRLAGHFYTPDGVDPPWPTVVMGGGWCYVKELIQPEYAQFFVDAGIAALAFDNRNLGESEGEPRQHISPWEQIFDMINALTYVSSRDDVDESRLGVWGISYAGGHVFPVAAMDRRVRLLISVVPMIDGWYTALRANSNVSLRERWAAIEADREARFRSGEDGTMAHSAHPHDKPSAWPAPETWPVFKKFKESVAPNHEHWTTVRSVELAMMYDVRPFMRRIIHQPTLMVTSWYDDITMTELEVPAFNEIPSPRKKLVQVGGDASHMSLYDNPDHLRIVGTACADFAKEYL
jgi:dienelactone hydrolase